MDEFIFRFVAPFVLSAVTLGILSAVGGPVGWGVYFTVVIIWLVVINGGFLLFGDDLNIFD